MNVKNESMNEELDIVKEFNTILESVADKRIYQTVAFIFLVEVAKQARGHKDG